MAIRWDCMGPINGMNDSIVKYFSLEEYINSIKVNDNVLFHLEETNKNLDKYLKYLTQFDDYSVVYYWIDSLSKEIKFSQEIENHYINPFDMLNNNMFFDSFQMNHEMIKKLHQFVMNSDVMDDYRCDGEEVRVSFFSKKNLEEYIYWRGALSNDVQRFMDDFIKIYKNNSVPIIDTDPFLKSALASLLFVRIHPFLDGNGRTSRMIYNIKFTDCINKIYNTNLKLCPLNISRGIFMYKISYANRINDIYFDLEHNSNDEINKWFDFILNRVDDEIYFNTNRISSLENALNNLQRMKFTDSSNLPIESSKMKINNIKK